MVVRKRKRRNKLLGQRTRGKGDTKNKRGAGSRGGRGRAGSHKHKYSKYYGQFGKEKKKVISRKVVKAINIDQLMQIMPKLLAAGQVTKEKGILVIDGKKVLFDKLLSNGGLQEKMIVRNISASKKAVEKIEKAGGKFEAEEAKVKEKPAAITAKEGKKEKNVLEKKK